MNINAKSLGSQASMRTEPFDQCFPNLIMPQLTQLTRIDLHFPIDHIVQQQDQQIPLGQTSGTTMETFFLHLRTVGVQKVADDDDDADGSESQPKLINLMYRFLLGVVAMGPTKPVAPIEGSVN